MDMNATKLVIAPTAKCPAHGAMHGTGFRTPICVSAIISIRRAAAPGCRIARISGEMCIRDRIKQSNTQIEIGIAMVNSFQMR